MNRTDAPDKIEMDDLEKSLWAEWRHQQAKKKRVLALVRRLTSAKFMVALQDEMDNGGVWPLRIVRRSSVRLTLPGRRRARIHRSRPEYDDSPWSHYFARQIGSYEDSYWGDIWFPLGGGRYLFCSYSI